MVFEQVMAARHLDLGHMASRAILRRDRACFCVCLPAGMAGLAFRVVMRLVGCDFFVWIVTSDTGNPAVLEVIALAQGESVGGKPHRVHVIRVSCYIVCRSMTLSAKRQDIFRRHRG